MRNRLSQPRSLSWIVLCVALVLTPACLHLNAWTTDELAEWHRTWGVDSPLYYIGSDEEHHYFRCRSADSWVHPWVPRSEIVIADERPHDLLSSGVPFPGYYAVDPEQDYRRLDETDAERMVNPSTDDEAAQQAAAADAAAPRR